MSGWLLPVVQAAAVAAAPETPAAAMARRADDVVALLSRRGDYAAMFAPTFRAAVPESKIDTIVTQLTGALGTPTGVEAIESVSPWSARVRIGYADAVLKLDLAIDPAGGHAITGLLTQGVDPRAVQAASVEAIVTQLAALPGATGFALARLGDGAPVPIAAHDAATPLAIGSAFKLVVLAELARSIAAGERRWTDMVTLDGSALPGGGYAQKPKGTRISYRDLAERMISVSDNSATDILLFDLGRAKVEAMLPVVGMTDGAPRNVPFLGALELFKLKGVGGGALGRDYLALDPAGRRRLLDGRVAATPIAAIPTALFQDGVPMRIGDLEWFASPNDLVRTMDWLRRHSEGVGEGTGGSEVRAILSKNPGLPAPAAAWDWVGFKGGSEPGVLTMTFLLRARDGTWRALSAGWNDPAKDVDTLRFTRLVGTALTLAAPR